MKKLLPILICCIIAMHTYAQAPFNTMDSVDINNITANVLVHGDMWWVPQTGLAFCKFPAHAKTSVNFAGSLWMAGYDGSGGLHVSAQTYRQDGNDYWPGPLDASDTLTYATSQTWANIWKVRRTDIQYFQLLTTHTVSNTPNTILTWPAKGNTFAAGAGGVALTISGDMAPFVDLNGNGIYEPLLGEYPDVPGDEALWWVYSDNGPTHTQTNGEPLDVEVHAMAYGYSRGTLIDDVIYYDYTIVNKSVNNYTSMRVAQWDDFDIGWYYDDFMGFDSTWRMGIGYNGTNDDGAGGGHAVNSYGSDLPHMGITIVVQPGDAGTNYVPAGSFDFYNNDLSIIGNPNDDTVINNYMRFKLSNGAWFGSYFSDSVRSCAPYGPGAVYVYPGDPSDSTQWSECACHYVPGDRRFVLSTSDFTLNAGNSAHLVFAMVAVDSAGGCPTTSFDSIRVVADTAWNIYHNPLAPLHYTSVSNVQRVNIDVNVYPSPADRVVMIELAGTGGSMQAYEVMSIEGRVVMAGQLQQGKNTVSVQQLSPGMYLINVNDLLTGLRVTKRFVKE